MNKFYRTCCRTAFVVVLVCSGLMLNSRNSHAAIDAVDVAVEAFAFAAQAGAGIPLNDTEKAFAKSAIKCIASGTPVADCGKDAVLKAAFQQLPKEAAGLAQCMVGGGTVANCAVDAAVKNLPKEAQLLATCITGGNLGNCAKKFIESNINVPPEVAQLANCMAGGGSPQKCATDQAIKQLPPEAQPVAGCVAQGQNVGACAKSFAAGQIQGVMTQAENDAFNALQKIKADTADALDKEGKGSLRNILKVVDGINKGDWLEVVDGGGPEVAKVVIDIVLNTLLTPVAAPVIGPIVNTVVDNRVQTFHDLIDAAKAGDPVKGAEVVAAAYMTMYIESPCALVPDNAFKEATCGNLGKAIEAIAGAGADIAKAILGVAKDILSAVGIYQVGDAIVGAFIDIINDVGHFLGIGGGDKKADPATCGPSNAFYANNYLACLGNSAKSSAAEGIATSLHNACIGNFSTCYNNADAICGSMDSAFGGLVNQVNAALDQGAQAYDQALGAFLQARSGDLCTYRYSENIDNAIKEFAGLCTSAIRKTIPLRTDSCKVANASAGLSGAAKVCYDGPGTGAARAQMNNQCEAYCKDHVVECMPPPACTDFNWDYGRVHDFCIYVWRWKFDPRIWEDPRNPRVRWADIWTDVIQPVNIRSKLPRLWIDTYYGPVIRFTDNWRGLLPTKIVSDKNLGTKIRLIRGTDKIRTTVKTNAASGGGFDMSKSVGTSVMDRVPSINSLNAVSGNSVGFTGIPAQRPCLPCGGAKSIGTKVTAPKASAPVASKPAAAPAPAPEPLIDYGGGGFRPPPENPLK